MPLVNWVQSTGSFFHDRSITLKNLTGIKSIIVLSRRSIRGRKTDHICDEKKESNNSKRFSLCFYFLCSRDSTDGKNVNSAKIPASLGHFLSEERRAAIDEYRRNRQIYGPDDELAMALQANSLCVNGQMAPPPLQSNPWFDSDVIRRKPLLFSCMSYFSCVSIKISCSWEN